MIQIENLRKEFGRFLIEIENFIISQGKYVVILGPSGSGKSLFLKIIAGLFIPEKGKILLENSNITSISAEKRNIGLVFQEPSLFPHMNIRDNISYGLKIAGLSKKARYKQADKIAHLLKIENLMNRTIESASGGELQRAALARTLITKPKVLLLDEPLSQLDHNTRIELQTELKKIHKEFNLTCIHVTHNREEAYALADKCAVMLDGRLIQYNDLNIIKENPFCPFIVEFLGLENKSIKNPPSGCLKQCMLTTGKCILTLQSGSK